MLSTANTKTSNTFWTNSKVTFEQKRNGMQFRKGTLYNQKIAYRNGKASSPNCLLCQHPDSQIHMLSGCQHETMKNMITERQHCYQTHCQGNQQRWIWWKHNIHRCWQWSQTHRAKFYKSWTHTANRTLPSWLLSYLSNIDLARASRPDITIVLPNGSNHTPHVHVQDLSPSTWEAHLIEFKYCDDTRPESQLEKMKSNTGDS